MRSQHLAPTPTNANDAGGSWRPFAGAVYDAWDVAGGEREFAVGTALESSRVFRSTKVTRLLSDVTVVSLRESAGAAVTTVPEIAGGVDAKTGAKTGNHGDQGAEDAGSRKEQGVA